MKYLISLVLLCAAATAQTGPQTYAGQQQRQIKALSADETKAFREGSGQGFARAAELNHFPGPMHVMELAVPLDLAPAQQREIAQLLERHKTEARALGAEVIRLEADLDALFAERRATRETVEVKAAEIGAAQARYRASHLIAHIETARMMTGEQITRYDRLRGYTGAPGAAARSGHGAHAH